jgi:geranylgeranyl pyrophosphate synthase
MKTVSSFSSCTNEDFQAYVLETKQLVETELENLLSNVSDSDLLPLLEYALLSKGKRLRPILAILSAQSVGGAREKAVKLALSFELLHTATLVHDDIIDQDTFRRGREPVHLKWSTNGAILLGDALIALSVNLAADYGSRIVKNLSSIGLELCNGEYVDVTLSLEDATEQDYYVKIGKKSASLFRGATFCGALAAGAESSELEALGNYGQCFGMAYQLKDDSEDLLRREQISQDLKNGNVTLPFLYMHQHGDSFSRKLLRENFGNKHVTVAVTQEIRHNMEEIGAFKYCQRKISEYSKKSQESLKDVRDSMFKDFLVRFSTCIDEFEAQSR